jgi:hypothetical protein
MVYTGSSPVLTTKLLVMFILEKNLTEKRARKIEDNMGERHAYAVNVVKDEDGTYMVVGGKEEKECYDNHCWQWDEDDEDYEDDEEE